MLLRFDDENYTRINIASADQIDKYYVVPGLFGCKVVIELRDGTERETITLKYRRTTDAISMVNELDLEFEDQEISNE